MKKLCLPVKQQYPDNFMVVSFAKGGRKGEGRAVNNPIVSDVKYSIRASLLGCTHP